MSVKTQYEQYWNQEAPPPTVDPTTPQRQRFVKEALTRFSKNTSGKRILDAGCGDGLFVEFFESLGLASSGIDVADTAVSIARKRCPNAKFKVGSLEDPLPFDAGEFDVVWCTEVLEHLVNVQGCLRGINRVLKQGGLFIGTVPYHGFIKNIAIVFRDFERHFDVEGEHLRFFTKRSLERSLASARLSLLETRYVGRAWPLSKSLFVVAQKTDRIPEQD